MAGKIIAGAVEITVVTAFEYLTGFCSGYIIGSVWGLPGLVFAKKALDQETLSLGIWKTIAKRLVVMHQRSSRWATTWGGVSAAGAGFGILARVVRGGVEDEWTTVLSSMAMGAFFCRQDGAMAMVKGAILYGTLVKLLSGSRNNLHEKVDVVVDF